VSEKEEYRPGLRAIRWLRPALTVLALLAFGLAYLISEPFREEVGRASGVLMSGEVEAVRN
jgi:hypothetical protein